MASIATKLDHRGNRVPAWKVSGGFVTQADISRYGSYAEARRMKDMGRG